MIFQSNNLFGVKFVHFKPLCICNLLYKEDFYLILKRMSLISYIFYKDNSSYWTTGYIGIT